MDLLIGCLKQCSGLVPVRTLLHPWYQQELTTPADAKAWGEGSENIFAKLDTISLELVSLFGLGPVQLDLEVIQHFAVVLKKLLLLLLLLVVVVVVVIAIADSRQAVFY